MNIKKKNFRQFASDKRAFVAFLYIIIIIFLSLFGAKITGQNLNYVDYAQIRKQPSEKHLLGTDDSGRDVLARLFQGGRISIAVALCATFFQLLIGVTVGILSGYFGKKVDTVLSRVIDVIMCFPFLVLAISIFSVLGTSMVNLIVTMSILLWPEIARVVRTEVRMLKNSEFIMAARAIGLNDFEIIIHHISPNIIQHIIVASTLATANGILTEASLSYLGLGVKAPMPSWGNMLIAAQNMTVLQHEWWLWIPPGIMVVSMVLAVNFVGIGLQTMFDIKKNFI